MHEDGSLPKHGTTGGLVTAVPMSVEEAKMMGEDLIKVKGGEMLSKASGVNVVCKMKPQA